MFSSARRNIARGSLRVFDSITRNAPYTMPSAVLFLPPNMMMFVNRPTMRSLYFGSGISLRLGTSRRRGIPHPKLRAAGRRVTRRPVRPLEKLLGPFGSVLRPTTVSVGDAGRVERSAYDVVTDARKILHAAAAHEHHRVLLEV